MTEHSLIDDWLDKWEQLNQHGKAPPLDTFIAEYCSGAPELIDAFRERALGLRSMDQRLRDLVSTLSSQRSDTADQAPGALLQPGQELRGYRPECKLGRGGFGEVWQATAPDGTRVALKYVPLDRSAANAELRGLDILRKIHHPHLITVLGAWQNDDALIIVMELADRTLRHRLEEAVRQGHPGIPRDELFDLLQQAAEGIDFLTQTAVVSQDGKKGLIAHRDIKPDNLLLKGTSVKIGDFGLARCLEHSLTSHTGPMTAKYAAPEFFESHSAKQSDQYSLAVSYCELRGGRPPFSGNQLELMKGHTSGVPDLSMLPPAERPVVEKALSKTPENRWPSCVSFVDALRQATLDAQRQEAEVNAANDALQLRTLLLADMQNDQLRRKYLTVRTEALQVMDARSRTPPGCLASTALFTSLSLACCIWILQSWSTPQGKEPEIPLLAIVIVGVALGAIPGVLGALVGEIGEGTARGCGFNFLIGGALLGIGYAIFGKVEIIPTLMLVLFISIIAGIAGAIAGAIGGTLGKLIWSDVHAELGPLPADAPTDLAVARRIFLPDSGTERLS